MAAVTIDLREGTFNRLGDSPERFVEELRLAAAMASLPRERWG